MLPQAVLFYCVVTHGRDSEQLLRTQRSAVEFSTVINRIIAACLISYGSSFRYAAFQDAEDREKAETFRQKATQDIDDMLAVSERHGDIVTKTTVARFARDAKQQFVALSLLKPAESPRSVGAIYKKVTAFRQFMTGAFRKSKEYEKLFASVSHDLERLMRKESLVISQISHFIAALIFANFTLGVLLSLWFSKHITSRLEILMQNAALLPQLKQLELRAGGADEIASLDEELHEASEELIKAAQFRDYLVQMVAHDMCSPLSAVELSLSIVRNVEDSSISENASENILRALQIVEDLVRRTNEILSIEKLNSRINFNSIDSSSRNDELLPETSSQSIKHLAQLMRFEIDCAKSDLVQREANFKPGVFRYGLMIVLLPLLVSTMILVCGHLLNSRAEVYLKEEAIQTDISARISRIIVLGMATYSYFLTYSSFGKPESVDLAIDSGAKEAKELEILFSQLKDKQNTIAEIKRITTEARAKAEKLVREIKAKTVCAGNNTNNQAAAVAATGIKGAFYSRKRQTFEIINSISTEGKSVPLQFSKNSNISRFGSAKVETYPDPSNVVSSMGLISLGLIKLENLLELSDSQLIKLKKVQREEELTRAIVSCLLWSNLLANICLPLAALHWFKKKMTARLALVQENALRISKRQKLLAPVQGNDEVWYLDVVIHEVSARLSAVSQQRQAMMEVVAKDLRTPLAAALVELRKVPASDLALMSALGSKHFKSAFNNIERILKLVTELLTVEQLEAGELEIEKEAFDIHEAVEQALQSVAAVAESLQISLSNESNRLVIAADRSKVVQVLVNYLANAINHTPKGSSVKVTTKVSAKMVELHVEDNGSGLSDEMKQKVFKRFYQTADSKARGKGYGLGLAICKMIADAHAGKVGVVDSPDGGCSFYISLPLRP